MFADLKQADYSVGGDVDILSKLASCPDKDDPTPDSCVMDDRFRTAIQQRMTVREALNDGLLDGTRIFGFDSNGREPEYYNGYPYRSLVILRKYRIIPVGWELAAKYMRDYASGNYGLNALIQEYNNSSSPFYRLVDPNWVLKAPDVYCKRQGVGEKIQYEQAIRDEDTNNDLKIDGSDAATTTIQRQGDYCADEQMCLKENEDGSCKRYGYCVEEMPLWKFDGTSCSSHYNTCQIFSGPGGEASYLKNTVDYDGCNASNAGCQWYCQDWSTATNQWVCINEAPPNGGEKMSFNRNAEECNSEVEGCHEFISIKGSGANLVKNSGFEDFDTTTDAAIATDGIRDDGIPIPSGGSSLPDDFMYWGDEFMDGANPGYLRRLATNDAFEGLTAARLHHYGPAGSYWNHQYIDTGINTDGQTFTMSFYAKTAADASLSDCAGDADVLEFNVRRHPAGVEEQGPLAVVHVGSDWTRYVNTFTFGIYDITTNGPWSNEQEMREAEVIIRHRLTGQNCDIIIDNIQLEEGGLTEYKPYEDSLKNYLRKAPDYYNCYDNDLTNDDQACDNYALSCLADDVGCEIYTSSTTGLAVAGIISNPNICDPYNPASCDQCPAEFMGCQAYRELQIEHAPRRPARDPVSFVADTGISCPASAVGCEEYTNLEEVALGGEGKEYYSWIKQCVNTDDINLKTYYTWEGSDEFGYQLKKYNLKLTNIAGDGGPCTNMAAESAALGANSWPTCVDDAIFDEDGDGIDEDHPAARCTAADIGVNPDCAEFYDTDGNTYYRIRSRVIYASEDCKTYRNTVDGPSANYHLIPGQGKACSAAHAGCRAYKGNAGDNIRIIYEEDFEGGTVDPWIGDAIYSNESTYVGGHSMLVSNSAAVGNAGDVLGFQADRSYTVSFWAKGAMVDSPVSFGFNTAPVLTFPGQAMVRAGEWGRYEIGPLYIPVGVDLSANQFLTFGSNAFYVDNIVITEIFENIYLVKDSYTECPGYENCDQYTDRFGSIHYLKSFSRLCGEDKVGCAAMIDTQNTASPDGTTYSVTRSRGDCDGDGDIDDDDLLYLQNYRYASGPAPYPFLTGDIDDDNDIDNGDISFLDNYLHASGPAPTPTYVTFVHTTIPADDTITLVNDPAKSCASTSKGCERLGLPIINVDGNASSFTDYYLKNNPDEYDDILCAYDRNDCEEYTTPGGSKHYFKDPGNKVCEFKRVTGQETAGWYLLGTGHGAPDCPVSNGLCLGGYKEGEVCNSSDDCGTGGDCVRNDNVPTQPLDGWVGLCPASDSGCTEYRDPEQPMIDSGSISDVNFAINGSFEQEPLYAGDLATYYTDGLYDFNAGVGDYVPDELIGWRQRQTDGGFCNDNNAATCDVDGDCSIYGAGGCDINNRVPCGNRLAAVTDATPDVDPTEGDKAILMQSYDYCKGGDSALYTWHRIDTGYLTDNRAFKVSFDAKRAPDALDADCAGHAAADSIYYQMTRTIDDQKPGGYTDYLSGLTVTAADTWENYEHTFYFGSAPRDWVATATTLDQLQRTARLVFRRPAEDVNPALPDDPVCDLIIDNVKVEEVTTTNFLNYTPYYYINDTVDQSTCNGIVSREEGCRLFEDTSNADLPYSTADSDNGVTPALCEEGTAYCDSNMVLKVIGDRECKRWLECETTVWSESDEGKTEELCTSRYLCDKMDEETGYCTNAASFEDVNQTFTAPAFADKIKYYSGMVLAGLDWGRRCSNDPSVVCTSNNDCLGGTCSAPQIVQGYLQYPSMEQVGDISTQGNLIKYGDFGDSDYKMNQILSCRLSGGCPGCGEIDATLLPADSCNSLDANPPTELDILDATDQDSVSLRGNWGSRGFYGIGAGANIFITEEDINNGFIPSPNANLDENNMLKVVTLGDTDPIDDAVSNGNFSGVSYNLGSSVIKDEQYVVSFKLRWEGTPLINDKIRVELQYTPGVAGGVNQSVAADITPSEEWQEYSLGPIIAGYPNGLIELASFTSVNLNIVHSYSPYDAEVPAVTFYLDDVSMKPVLTVRHGVCESLKAGYPDNGKQCKSIGDCVLPGFDDGAVACVEQKNIPNSCRLYPREDSPYCTYVDENNTTYQGWYGYCIEHDPNNSKYCINWWPVDLLLGESDAFSALPSFMSAIGHPGYYCLKTAGNYNKPIDGKIEFDWEFVLHTASANDDPAFENAESSYQLLGAGGVGGPQEFGYRRPMASRIFNLGGNEVGECKPLCSTLVNSCSLMGGNWLAGAGDGSGYTGFIMANDAENVEGGNCSIHPGNSSVTTTCSSTENKGCGDAGSFSPEDEYYKYEIEYINFIINRWSHSDWAENTTATTDGPSIFILDHNSECENLNNLNCWTGTWMSAEDKNKIIISVNFDADDKLSGYSVYATDYANGGGAWIQGIFHLSEQCTEIAQAVSDDLSVEPIAWQTRLARQSPYYVPELLYYRAKDAAPYGSSVVPSGERDPINWDYLPGKVPFSDNDGPLYVGDSDISTRAGSPYSCDAADGNCAGRMCSVLVSGRGYSTQNECKNYNDMIDCHDALGYCIGLGTGFCINDNTVFCENNADCFTAGVNGDCSTTGGGAVMPPIVTALEGIDKLKRLFVNGYNTWQWKSDPGFAGRWHYTLNKAPIDKWNDDYQLMLPCHQTITGAGRPAYDPAIPITGGDYCGMPPVIKNIRAGNVESPGSITFGPQGGRVQLSFTIDADPDQLPIKYIEVDWDDGTESSKFAGKYADGTINFTHDYRQSQTSAYVPRILVYDNWNWCGVAEGQDMSAGDHRFADEVEDANGHDCTWVDTGIEIFVTP